MSDELTLWIEKYVFGYAAGKTRMKAGLVRMIPPHKVYCEPFCGGASVFFAKEASQVEVLADSNAEIIGVFRMIQTLTKAELDQLRQRDWVSRRKLFMRLKESKPTDKVSKLHRFLYLRAFSFSRLGAQAGYDSSSEGRTSKVTDRVARAVPRLKGVKLIAGDYEAVVRKHDSPGTFFFFDPPYVGYNVGSGIGEREFDEARFRKLLKSLKGKFVLTYDVKGKLDLSGFNVQRVAQRRTVARGTDGVSRDPVLATLVVTNFKAPAYKAFDGTGIELEEDRLHVSMVQVAKVTDGGMHVHFLDRQRRETNTDGAHSHSFMTEDEAKPTTFIRTIEGGPHVHKFAKPDADESGSAEKHKHKVVIHGLGDYYAPRRILETGEERGHTHELDVSTTAYDGSHAHELITEKGDRLKSITPGQFAAMQLAKAEQDPYLEVPEHGTPRPAVLQARASSEGELAMDLWFDNGNSAIGWTFKVARGQIDLGRLTEFAERFTVDGDRYTLPLTSFCPARGLGTLDLGILKVDGEVEGGRIAYVDACAFEHGLHTEGSHEYFLSKGAELVGVVDVLRDGCGDWYARVRRDDLLPAVLSKRACLEGWIPPLGCSGLPQSLEAVVPDSLRYWNEKHDLERARELRDLLVASRLVTKERLAIVDGEIRLVERQVTALAEPHEPTELAPDWAVKAMAERYAGSVAERFGTSSESEEEAELSFHDLTGDADCLIGKADAIDSVVKLLASDSSDFAVMCLDCSEARAVLSKYGRPFRLVPEDPNHAVEVCDRLFLASFPLLKTSDVVWVDEEELEKAAPIAKPFAGFESFNDCVSSVMASQKVSEAAARRICGRLQAETEKADGEHGLADDLFRPYTSEISLLNGEGSELFKAKEEERFVLGIVLEPETEDSQHDVYSAEEIRKAAHGFMAEFQNMGLMHRTLVNGKVQILESYLAPVAFSIGKQKVKKGTWLLGTRVLDDDLWGAVKTGKLQGYSIGGSAVRRPERPS